MSGSKAVPPSPDAVVLEVGEVAYLLRVSPSHINQLVRAGKIPRLPVDILGRRRHLIPRKWVDEVIAQAAVIETAPATEEQRALQVVHDLRAANGVRETSDGGAGEGPTSSSVRLQPDASRRSRTATTPGDALPAKRASTGGH